MKVNDVVLIKSPVHSRPYWKMGVVTQLIHGDDNKVRFVHVRTSSGKIDQHSIKNLYPLELSLTHNGTRRTETNQKKGAPENPVPAPIIEVRDTADPNTSVPSTQPNEERDTAEAAAHSSKETGGTRTLPREKRAPRRAALAARKQFLDRSDSEDSE